MRYRVAAAAAVMVATALSVGAPAGAVSAGASAGAHLVPADTVVGFSTTSFDISVDVDGIDDTITCSHARVSGTTPADGLTIALAKPPTFPGCTDSLGGTDEVTANGTWSVRASATGKMLSFVIPKDGMKAGSSVLSGCIITFAPKGPATVSGTFDDLDRWQLTHAPVPAKGNAQCTVTSASFTSTFVLKPGVSVVS